MIFNVGDKVCMTKTKECLALINNDCMQPILNKDFFIKGIDEEDFLDICLQFNDDFDDLVTYWFPSIYLTHAE